MAVQQKTPNHLNKHASIFTAECYAVSRALDIANLYSNTTNFLIFTDSQSTVKSLQKPTFKYNISNHIIEIKTKYSTFISNNKGQNFIKFIWIPAHVGIIGNEEADSLAKEATKESPSPDIKVSIADLTRDLKIQARLSTNTLIKKEGLIKGVNYVRFYHKDKGKPWYTGLALSRDFLVFVNRCRANHYNLNGSLARVNFIANSACQCGAELQDLNHVIWQCPDYENERNTLETKLLKGCQECVEPKTAPKSSPSETPGKLVSEGEVGGSNHSSISRFSHQAEPRKSLSC
ncbi:uncharacterized protein LOC143358179 [Halictus rubicundus]|uniref:uncharacterized protein LOC143358179 n=1 Tax=Halictus rubicundus TaxID=77578 RepID=UPI00403570D5